MDVITTRDDGLISIAFQIENFIDAIVLPLEQFDSMKQSDIEAIKQSRYNNYLAFVASMGSE